MCPAMLICTYGVMSILDELIIPLPATGKLFSTYLFSLNNHSDGQGHKETPEDIQPVG